MKMGLMYVSDYGFAVSSSYWTEALYDYDNSTLRSNNWMYLGADEWTISRRSDDSGIAFLVASAGAVYGYYSANFTLAVRPCFYLNSDVAYISGSGTESDPIRIN